MCAMHASVRRLVQLVIYCRLQASLAPAWIAFNAASCGMHPRLLLAGFPQPGVSPCLASACLYFAGLPRNLEERELRAECSKHSKVQLQPACRGGGVCSSAVGLCLRRRELTDCRCPLVVARSGKLVAARSGRLLLGAAHHCPRPAHLLPGGPVLQVECAVRPPNVPGGAFVTFKSVRWGPSITCLPPPCEVTAWVPGWQALLLLIAGQGSGLWAVPERVLHAACMRTALNTLLTFLPSHPPPLLATSRDASRCYEAMCDALPWRERGSPLRLSFVASQVYPPAAPQRIQVSRQRAVEQLEERKAASRPPVMHVIGWSEGLLTGLCCDARDASTACKRWPFRLARCVFTSLKLD